MLVFVQIILLGQSNNIGKTSGEVAILLFGVGIVRFDFFFFKEQLLGHCRHFERPWRVSLRSLPSPELGTGLIQIRGKGSSASFKLMSDNMISLK